ncbi:GDYXXLXY domain-containing protein [Marinicella gelatinilytica]|uniref:GDYXXLXY domain-containing protein n=1 Tax=Marinicella gelatinilytica TaxID=2996017 RepID=UPI002260A679|nr:GDYXXLXY domain-containing protein [Marinicella gelatinilytica]MCX7545234.1 GDYXXLXY domain-containing protein [Marinicella gelatinilytica]
MNDVNVLWQQLKAKQMTTQVDAPPVSQTDDDNSWFVHVLQAVGGWFAAIFLTGFIGFMIVPIFDYPLMSGALGLVLNFAALHFYRQQNNNKMAFLKHLFLALSLAGQLLVSFAVAKHLGWQTQSLFYILAVYQLLLVWLMQDFVHRLLSTLFAVTLLFWGHSFLLVSGVGSALLGALLVWLWMDKIGWHEDKKLYEPMAYALALSLVGLNVQALSWYWQLGRHVGGDLSVWFTQSAVWLNAVLHIAVYGYLWWRLQRQSLLPQTSAERGLILFSLIGFALLGFVIHGFSGAALLLILGFVCRNRILSGLGVLAMLGFVSWYYYHLDVSLLVKSMTLTAMGVVMLIAVWLTRRPSKEANGHSASQQSVPWIAVVTFVIVVIVVNTGIYQKQMLIKDGDFMLLELAPVDPRSLMQGDYMRLRFALSNTVNQAQSDNHDLQPSNQIVVKTNQQSVAAFQRFYQGQPLEDNEYLLSLKHSRWGLVVPTDAYFFEEGSAKLYEQAEYGGFRVSRQGDSILTGLYNADFQLISAADALPEN